jgi:hypothetical protein
MLRRGQSLEVGGLERDLTGSLGECVHQLAQEQRVALDPWPRLSIPSAEREPGQERRGLGQRRVRPLEADAGLLVQRLDQGDLPGRVAL